MNTLAIIQARIDSARFPCKVLADLAGKPILRHVVERVAAAREVDRVVIATPNVAIAKAAEPWDCDVHVTGHVGDVLARFAAVTGTYADYPVIVRVCGDCPRIDTAAIDGLLQFAKSKFFGGDYFGYWLPAPEDGPAIAQPTGYFAEVVMRQALRRLQRTLPVDDPSREHVTQAMYDPASKVAGQFVKYWLSPPVWYHPDLPRTAIDTIADLLRVREILLEETPHA